MTVDHSIKQYINACFPVLLEKSGNLIRSWKLSLNLVEKIIFSYNRLGGQCTIIVKKAT